MLAAEALTASTLRMLVVFTTLDGRLSTKAVWLGRMGMMRGLATFVELEHSEALAMSGFWTLGLGKMVDAADPDLSIVYAARYMQF